MSRRLRFNGYTLVPACLVFNETGRGNLSVYELQNQWALPGGGTRTTEELAELARAQGVKMEAPRLTRFVVDDGPLSLPCVTGNKLLASVTGNTEMKTDEHNDRETAKVPGEAKQVGKGPGQPLPQQGRTVGAG